MTLETWLSLNRRPGESRRDAVRRYAEEEQEFDSPADKQGFIDYNTDYKIGTLSPTEYAQQSFDPSLVPTFDTPSPQEQAYIQDPDLWDSLMRGTDLAQASWYGAAEGAGAGFLDDLGFEDASAGLKDWAREGRLEQEAEAAQIAPAKSIKQELEEDPDSWYKHLDPDMMTLGQMAESAPTSLSPWLAAVPLAMATPYLASAAGIAATGTIGSKLIAAGVGMGAGNLASSAIVSSEAYDRGKSDPIIRQQMGIDPDKRFEDLPPEDQQIIDRVATDLSQTSFGHRLYTAGLVEMASYIPYGHAMLRLALDTGLGTASEVWDRVLYSEDAVSALIENGVPAEKAEELRNAILEAGPSFRQVMISAMQQEFVMGGTATTIESLIGQKDNRVNKQATASRVLNEEVKRASELKYESDQKQLEYDRKVQLDREKQLLKSQAQEKFLDQKAWEQQQAEQLKANNKELLEQIKHANKLEEKSLADQAIEYDLEDLSTFYDEEGNLTADFYGSDTALRSAQEIEASFSQNLPVSVEDLNLYNEVINQRMADLKKGSDLERQVKQRQRDIEAKIKELTEAEAAQDTTEARQKRKQAIEKEETTLKNMEGRIFGVKGENASRFGWPAEKFVQYRAWKKRKLALEQRKELENTKLRTQEQIERQKKRDKKALEKQAADLVDQTEKRSAIQSDGEFQLDKGLINKYIEDLGNRHERYKGIYTVLDGNSINELATILEKNHNYPKNKSTEKARQLLAENNAWVMGDHVYVNADQIKGSNRKEALENLVKIVTFHEPMTHIGLKRFLGKDYKPFLDNFYNTNKDDIQTWLEEEAPEYLQTEEQLERSLKGLSPKEQAEFMDNLNRDHAEEFLANKFVELGILDPDIVTKTADALVSALKGVVDPLNKRISTTQARSVLAEVQRNYLGGKKNIITGDLFDPANWTMKGIEIAEGDEDKVTAYRRYLKEQGIEYTPATFKEPETVKAEVFQEAPFKLPVKASKRALTPRQAEIWKAKNKIGKGRRKRIPELVALAEKLETGKASYEEYQKKADELLPIKRFSSVPKAATDAEILGSIKKDQYDEGLILGEDALTKKDVVNVRLDIPAYERYDSWVATITHGGKSIYGAAVRLKDVTFKAPLMGALRIAQGARKYPLATMKGTWQENSVADIEKMAKNYINDPAWVQIGYNPERQSSFYIREDKNGETKGTPLESADEIIQVGAFILAKNPVTKDTPSYTTKEGVTFKFSKKLVSAKDFKTIRPPNLRFTKLQKQIYALLKTPDKGIEYTRKYLNRKDHPSPKNKSESFELPNGHKVWIGAGKTVDNWIEQVESVLTPSEIKRERNWYPKVKKLFEDTFGKEDAPKMILAWALGNKAESPLGAMKNVLRARENLAKKINKDLMKKGGLNDEAITSVLRDLPPEGGSGVKLFDFVDASIDATTRVWTGHDNRMGGPAVVDRHTWRDGGYIDEALLNILKEGLPNDPRVKKLKLDRVKPSVTDPEYEQTAMWLRDITIALNAKNFAGVNTWTPNAVQAVGWMSMAKITGQAEGGTAVQAVQETSRDVLFEITPGTDAPLLKAFPQLKGKKLSEDQRRTLTSKLGDIVTEIALKETGVLESVREKGTGWYLDNDAQPNILSRVNASKDGLLDLIHIIGYLAQQDSVLAYGAQNNARQIGIDFLETDGKFSDTTLLDKFYKGLRKAHPNYFSGGTEGIVRGKPVFRALLFDPQAPANLKVGERKLWIKKESNKIIKEITPTINQLAKDLDLNIRSKGFAMTTISADNNWTENKNGELYTRRIVQRFRPHISRRILDNGPKKVTKAIQKQLDGFGIKYSKRTRTPTTAGTARRVYKGQLEVESDGQSHFVHWSKTSDLTETDPSYYGTGMKGAEQKFQKGFPDLWVNRTFFGLPGYRRESGVGINMYEVAVDPNTMYDLQEDPDGVWRKAVEEVGKLGDRFIPRAEGIIKELGYAGYFRKDRNAGVFYHPTKVKFIRQEGGSPIYTPSIRVMASKRLASKDKPRDKWLQFVTGQQEGIEPVGRPETPEWNEFMEGSKIKYPLYHGSPFVIEKRYTDTQAELEAKGGKYEGGGNIYSASFQFDKLKEGQFNYTGLHLSSEPEYANMYADKDVSMDYSTLGIEDRGPNVIKGFVNVKNPMKIDVTANVNKWKEGINDLRIHLMNSDKFGTKRNFGASNYKAFEFLEDMNKKENIRDKERLIERLDPKKIFSKEEIRGIKLYTFDRLNLRPGESHNREFLEYVAMALEHEMPSQKHLDAAMNMIIVDGMGHDALLYVQEIGDNAPRPFVGVMLLDPEFTSNQRLVGEKDYFDENAQPKFPFRSAYNQKPNDPSDVKFSKRVKNYSPDELVAEWRANVKGDAAPPPIKVGDKKTISSVARAMSRIMKLGKISPLNNKETIIGKTAVEIQPHMDGESLWFKSIRAFEKGRGEGTKTMDKILKIAKEEKVNLRGNAKAFGTGGMTSQQLEKWYQRFGYEIHENEIVYRGKPEEIIILTGKMKTIDISPEAITNPDGNIKASKILASRAAHHAISTRDTGKKKPLRYRIAEKLTRRLVAQGTLPDAEKYKALRRIASGTIVKAEEAGRKLYDVLKKTKQPTAIYRYFTEKDFDASNIKNAVERKAAVEAKAKIQNIGIDLVGMGLMDEGARLQYEGQYLPQMYLKYLIPDEAVIKVRGGGIRIDAGYLKKRRDIPEGVKKLILGEIKDPAYLATRATTVPIKDMAIINWLQQIAANPNWVLPSTLVEFDMLGEMKKAAVSLDTQKQLELKDTKGVKISAHWLANEASRMFNQTKYMPDLTKEEFKIIQDVTTKMENLAKEVNDNVNVDPSQYSTVPKTAKYGMLGGMAVRKEIANDIFGGMNMTTGDLSMAESILGDGGVVGDYNRLWKWSKVSANPPSWVRNFVSNMILMNMGGVAWYKMPGLILSSLKDMRKVGKHKGALHQLAKDLGLTAGNFSNVELGRIEREFKDLQVRLNKKGAGPMGVLGMMKGAFNKVQDVTADTYGGIDSLGKMMMLKNSLNEAKMKVKDLSKYTPAEMAKLEDIALNAEKWLFDYSNPLPSVKWLRRAPFGAPFISFTSFVAPLMLETAITKPWKFLPYYALGYAAKEWFKEVNDLDEEKYEGLKVSMSEYLREKAFSSVFPAGVVPWPYVDENGRVVFQDISYLFPWGMFSEMGGEIAEGKYFDAMKTAGLMGGPTLNVASAILTGIDPFTRQPIVDPTGDFTEQSADVAWYVFNLTMPPMFHGIGQGPNQGYGAVKRLIEAYTGQLTKEGEARFTKTQAWLRMFGQNVTPIAVPEGRNKQLRYEYSKLKKLERLAKRDLKNSIIMQESEKEIKEKLNAYRDKIIKARNELQKKINISTPPMSLLRQREEALRKMRQRLQQRKAS